MSSLESEVLIQAVEREPRLFKSIANEYKTPEICERGVDIKIGSWFV